MKKIVIILGSSAPNGKTFHAVQLVMSKICDADFINLADFNVKDYDYEWRNENDDFNKIIERVLCYETIILATPIYFYTISAPLKRFVDRLSSLINTNRIKLLTNKNLAVISSYATHPDGKDGFEKIFINIANFLKMNYLGCYFHYTGTDQEILSKNVLLLEMFLPHLCMASSEKAMISDLTVNGLIEFSQRQFDVYDMGSLPFFLQRNSLRHHYLRVYPSIGQMLKINERNILKYPSKISNMYIHVPFYNGGCDCCDHLIQSTIGIVPNSLGFPCIEDIRYLDKTTISQKMKTYFSYLKAEIAYHSKRTILDLNYIEFRGGSPNLVPMDVMDDFLTYLRSSNFLKHPNNIFGSIKLHPDFFDNIGYASEFLDMVSKHGIRRISIGHQFSKKGNIPHNTDFLSSAVKLLRSKNIMFNLDLMYGVPKQTLQDWGQALKKAVEYKPDSIATYFLFVNQGAELHRQIQSGKVKPPSFRTIQVMHIMAQEFLSKDFYELPNDSYASRRSLFGDPDTFQQYSLPSNVASLPIGSGSYGYFNDTQFCNFIDPSTYAESIDKGLSPIWCSYILNQEQQIYRDIQFSLKNEPSLQLSLFNEKYKIDITQDSRFSGIFEQLNILKLVIIDKEKIKLTSKGRLCVEEIACLFHDPSITFANEHDKLFQLTKHFSMSAASPQPLLFMGRFSDRMRGWTNELLREREWEMNKDLRQWATEYYNKYPARRPEHQRGYGPGAMIVYK